MKGIVMAGGFGTRLKPLTNDLPKPLVPMATRPIIDPIIELLQKNSITELSVLLYFQPDLISGHLGNGSSFGVNIKYIIPTVDLGTAGAVAYAMREAGDNSTTLVISGDVLTDIDLKKAIEFHKKRKSIATIVLTRVENPLSFGIVITDTKGRIKKFLEKPGWGEVFSDTINTGIYILESQVLDCIPKDGEFDFSKDLFPALLERKMPMFGYIAEGYWKDVGSLDEFRQANMDILKGSVKFSIPGEKVKGRDIWAGHGAKIDFTSRFEGALVVGANARIGAEVRIVNSVIGSNSVVEEGATIIDSVVWDNVRIKRGASMQEAIVGGFTEVHEGAHLSEGSVVSDHC
ncbi:MAG: NDP-sugar synthase, partial [Deltaproteobacteria bacterium]